MTDFAIAIPIILDHEKGYTVDTGGPTNWGISLNMLKDNLHGVTVHGIQLDFDRDGDVDANDIRAMPQATAIQLYKELFWKPEYEKMEGILGIKVFDFAVNMGTNQAHILLQRACRAFGKVLKEDGNIGPVSMGMISGIDPIGLFACLSSEAAGFYRALSSGNPVKYKQYLNGWLNRAYDTYGMLG